MLTLSNGYRGTLRKNKKTKNFDIRVKKREGKIDEERPKKKRYSRSFIILKFRSRSREREQTNINRDYYIKGLSGCVHRQLLERRLEVRIDDFLRKL